MFFGGGFDMAPRPGIFSEYYRCYSAAFLPGKERENINHGSKVILPPSALAKLTSLHIEYPMLFQVTNEETNKSTHCGVLEFIAEEGRVYVPRWMMTSLALTEGSLVKITNRTLPQGKFVKIQPQSVDFLDIYDPKAVLERAFRGYSTLTQGDIISFEYNDRTYEIQILEVRPAEAVSILETDLEVDFAPPVGYKEPTTTKKLSGATSHVSIRDEVAAHVAPSTAAPSSFSGSGVRLGGTKSRSVALTSSTSSVAEEVPKTIDASGPLRPLRLPLGHLYFGFEGLPPPPGQENAAEGGDGDGARWKGEGNVLRTRKGKGKAGGGS